MEIKKRNSAYVNLDKYCQFAKPGDFLEATEWINGEGFTISINSNTSKVVFDISRGEMDAMKKCIKALN